MTGEVAVEALAVVRGPFDCHGGGRGGGPPPGLSSILGQRYEAMRPLRLSSDLPLTRAIAQQAMCLGNDQTRAGWGTSWMSACFRSTERSATGQPLPSQAF